MAAWESLPAVLLSHCLRDGAPSSDQSASFATCTSFTKAMLLPDPDLTDPQLTIRVHDFRPALVTLLRWAHECPLRLKLECSSEAHQPAPLQPLLDALQEGGVNLSAVRKVCCKGLLLDTGNLSALAPNLRELQLQECVIDDDMQPLSGCNHLQELTLGDQVHAPEAWYTQLATLPSLACLALNSRWPIPSFLPLLKDQLTQLRLDAGDAGIAGAASLSAWLAGLRHAAKLTNLRTLHLSLCTPQLLTTLSTLPHLQQLKVGFGDQQVGDTETKALLRFPRLTSLTFTSMGGLTLQQSYADQPCRWEELELVTATPQALARLPLQSVSVLRLGGLTIPPDMTAADVYAAAANIDGGQPTRICGVQGLLRILPKIAGPVVQGLDQRQQTANEHAERLLAIAPLVPLDITAVRVTSGSSAASSWSANAATVVALQQALPPTITTIQVEASFIHPSFWPQLAMSFPHLKQLCIHPTNECSSEDIMAYYTAARAAHTPPGIIPQAAHVQVQRAGTGGGDSSRRSRSADTSFAQLNLQLRLLGFTAQVRAQWWMG